MFCELPGWGERKEESRGSVNIGSLSESHPFLSFFELLASEMARVCQASCSVTVI